MIAVPISFAAQDYVKENPELERLLMRSSAADREQLNKMLSSMTPEARQEFIQGLIDVGLSIEKNGIVVDHVFARLRKIAEGQQGLTVSNILPSVSEPLKQSELAELAALPLRGVLEIVHVGRGGVEGAQREVRIVVIMQKPVAAPIEFALPAEGSLMIVQMEDRWLTVPSEYTRSTKTIAIRPSRPDWTSVDYDIGNGRAGSDVYSWSR